MAVVNELVVRISADMAQFEKSRDKFNKEISQMNGKEVKTNVNPFDSKGMNASVQQLNKEFQNLSNVLQKSTSKDFQFLKKDPLNLRELNAQIGAFKLKIEELSNTYDELTLKANDAFLNDRFDEYRASIEQLLSVEERLKNYEDALRQTQAQTMDPGFSKSNIVNTSDKIEEQKKKVRDLAEAYKELKEQYMSRIKSNEDFGTDEMYKLQHAVFEANDALIHETEILNTLRKEFDQLNSSTPDDQKVSKVAVAWNKVKSSIDTIGSKVKQLASKFASAFGKMILHAGKLLVKLNPFTKIIKSIGTSITRLGRRIKEVILYSTIIQWFQDLKQQISSYLEANQKLQNTFARLRGAWLTAFQPIYEYAIPKLIQLCEWLTKVGNVFASFMSRITGKSLSSMKANAEALYNQAQAIEANGESAKEASKYLAGFDELNVMNKDSSTSSSSSSSDDFTALFDGVEYKEPTTFFEKFSSFLDYCISKLPSFNELLGKASEKLNAISSSIVITFNDEGIREKVATLASGIAESFNQFIDDVDWKQLGESIGSGIDLLFSGIQSYFDTFDSYAFGDSFAQSVNGIFNSVDWEGIGTTLTTSLNDVLDLFTGFFEGTEWNSIGSSLSDALAGAISTFDGEKVAEAINSTFNVLDTINAFINDTDWSTVSDTLYNEALNLVTSIDWATIIKTMFEIIIGLVQAELKIMFTLINNLVSTFVEDIWPVISKFFSDFGEWLDTNIATPVANFFTETWDSISSFFSGVFEDISDFFTSVWERIKEVYGPAFQFFKSLFESIWKTVSDVFYDIQVIISGCWSIIKTIFSSAANSVKQVWSSVANWFNHNVTTPISNFFSTMWNGTKSKAQAAWNGIKSVFSTVGTFFYNTFSKAWQGIVSIFSAAGSTFTDIKDAIVTAFKSVVNSLITGINSVVSVPFNGINALINKLKGIKILGLTPFKNLTNISVPTIPYLANGGVITQPTLGLIGEYAGAKSNPEIVTPESKMREVFNQSNGELIDVWLDTTRQIISAIENKDMNVSIGDNDIASSVRRSNSKSLKMTGRTLLGTV